MNNKRIARKNCTRINKKVRRENPRRTQYAERIERLIADARAHVARSVNIAEVITKYEIGRIIIEVVQEGEERATYGKQLLQGVSDLLTERLGDGWSVETLKKCRQFYQIYSVKGIGATPSTQLPATDWVYSVDPIQKSATLSRIFDAAYPITLSWSHYVVLMRIDSDAERSFYENECQKQNWSVRQLQRQYNSSLYERLALSRNKDAVMRLAQEGQTISKPDDILKNPLILEFLGLKPETVYSESKLENAIIDNMQQFLLELAKVSYSRPGKNGLRLTRRIFMWIWCSTIACCNAMS